ncbi:DUF1826 domain-containing protein [Algicola sagamiensis]|uniref:DUF1826 domain-containing protein n=1 Tax=Algicola sagamiensis TaxID=163869 RepID=UPI0003698879|nr:DUF1826 domain-containing protein [Algicola sagamiensis]
MSTMTSNISPTKQTPVTRFAITGKDPSVLTDIYQEKTNLVIWQRHLSQDISNAVQSLFDQSPNFQASWVVSPDNVGSVLHDRLGSAAALEPLLSDITQLVDMFCCLFDLRRAGMRITVLDRAMCPRFHVDRVPCRLVTTYQGDATQWIPHHLVNRAQLGGQHGLDDEQSGLFDTQDTIEQCTQGDVALLKGELWAGNEGAGLVHRSPPYNRKPRLIVTLDFAD